MSKTVNVGLLLVVTATVAGAMSVYRSNHPPLVTIINHDARLRCAVIGDSIAQMVGSVMKECVTNAKVGVSSTVVVGYAQTTQGFEWTVVSAGTNNPHYARLDADLHAIRASQHAVIWLLPQPSRARALMASVAAERHDPTISFADDLVKDRYHPKFLTPIATQVRAIMNGGKP